MKKYYYIKQAGKELGPYDSKTLKSMARLGGIQDDALIRLDNQKKWQLAINIKGLFPEEKNTHTQIETVRTTESSPPIPKISGTNRALYYRFADWIEHELLHTWKPLKKTSKSKQPVAPNLENKHNLPSDDSQSFTSTVNKMNANSFDTSAAHQKRQFPYSSSLIRCPDCRNKISESANTCPKCGKPINDEIVRKAKSDAESSFRNIMIGVGAFFLLGLIGAANKQSTNDDGPVTHNSSYDTISYEEKAITVSPNNPGRTFEEKQRFAKDAIMLRDVLEQYSKARGY